MKTFLLWVWRVLLTVGTLAVLLFSVGTVLPWLPFIGSVANIATVGWLHLWVPLVGVLFVVSLVRFFALRKQRKGGLVLLCAFVSLLCTAAFTGADWLCLREAGLEPALYRRTEDVSAVKTETLAYTTSDYGELLMNVYYTEDGAEEKPVMVYIHGGGWIQGSRENHADYSRAFASHGYVVFSMDYDLSTEERHLAAGTERQICEAFAWVKNHAADYGADVAKLFVMGGSAGGNLALELSYKINSGVYQTAADGTELPAVKAVSVTFPVAGVADFYRNRDLVLGSMAHRMASWYTGVSPEEDPALFASLEPINAVTRAAAPTCILVGAGDSLVPPEATYRLHGALDAAGVANECVVVPYGNHILDKVPGSMMNSAYLDLTFRWFEQFL